LSNETPLEVWLDIGRRLASLHDSSAWWIGDWIVFGQDRYPDRYRKAIAGTTLDYQTLRNYAWIARRFHPSRRRDKLSFQHHVVVAALPVPDQDHWLDLALRHKWSRNELRRQLNASSGGSDDDRPSALSLTFSASDVQRWRATARQRNLPFELWIKASLDEAARAHTDQRPDPERMKTDGVHAEQSGDRRTAG